MAYRKFSRPFRRSAPRRRGVRFITEPRRWDAANFWFQTTMTTPALGSDTLAFSLMNVNHFDDFGVNPRQLTDAIRTVEVGGVVWDTTLSNPMSASTTSGIADFFEVLATDRLVDNDGLPATLITMDWTLSQAPVSASAAGVQDADFPVRIHKRRHVARIADSVQSTTSRLAATAYPLLSNTWGTQKVRLKGSLGDRQGLFFFCQLFSRTEAIVTADLTIAGTLYYRVKF